jgi:hypothetical protein
MRLGASDEAAAPSASSLGRWRRAAEVTSACAPTRATAPPSLPSPLFRQESRGAAKPATITSVDDGKTSPPMTLKRAAETLIGARILDHTIASMPLDGPGPPDVDISIMSGSPHCGRLIVASVCQPRDKITSFISVPPVDAIRPAQDTDRLHARTAPWPKAATARLPSGRWRGGRRRVRRSWC